MGGHHAAPPLVLRPACIRHPELPTRQRLGATQRSTALSLSPLHKKMEVKATRRDRRLELVTAARSAGKPPAGSTDKKNKARLQRLQPSPSQLCGWRSAHPGAMPQGAFISSEARNTRLMRLKMRGGGLSNKRLYQLSQRMQ